MKIRLGELRKIIRRSLLSEVDDLRKIIDDRLSKHTTTKEDRSFPTRTTPTTQATIVNCRFQRRKADPILFWMLHTQVLPWIRVR